MGQRPSEQEEVSPGIFLGIDPGKTGGLAVLHNGGRSVHAEPMPPTTLDLYKLLDGFSQDVDFACLEQVNSMPGEGHAGAFTFGTGYGMLQMGLTATGIPYEFVTPRTWQKALGIKAKAKAESKPQFKERLRAKAQQLFPAFPLWGAKGTLVKQRAVCDAMLIAEYCRRKHEGIL